VLEVTPETSAILAAPVAGSFLGVIVARHASPKSIIAGRSRCDACHHVLGLCDLVPFASWLATRGRCRYCGGKLGLFYPTIELAALAIALWSTALVSGWLVWASCFLGWTLLALAAIDIHDYRLPDFLTIPLMVTGLGVTAIIDQARVPEHVAGAAAGYLSIVVIRHAYRFVRHREGIGLGDAKLLAAAGAWGSWEALPTVVLLGAAAAFIWIACRSASAPRRILAQPIPLGAFLCLGTWLACLYGPIA
jgi:leader peptidase (prepilin peptidase)/N-methyltransferase